MTTTTARHTRHCAAKLKTASAAGLLALFLFYFIGCTLFTHTHRFGDITVVHSHYYAPWGKTADATPTHSHSAEQFKTIQHLDYLVFIVAIGGIACLAFRHATSLSVPARCARPADGQPHSKTRGPPAFAVTAPNLNR